MNRTPEQKRLREQYLIALIEATVPLQKEGDDREVTLELLIEAAGMLQQHLEEELTGLRVETD